MLTTSKRYINEKEILEYEKGFLESEKNAIEIQNAQETPRLDEGVSIHCHHVINYIDFRYDRLARALPAYQGPQVVGDDGHGQHRDFCPQGGPDG